MEQQKLVLVIFYVLVVIGAVSITVLTLNLPKNSVEEPATEISTQGEFIRPSLTVREPIDTTQVTEPMDSSSENDNEVTTETTERETGTAVSEEEKPANEDSGDIVVETKEKADDIVRNQIANVDNRHTTPGTPVEDDSSREATSSSSSTATTSTPKSVLEYWIQAGSFTSQSKAQQIVDDLEDKGLSSVIVSREVNDTQYFRVRIGPYAEKPEAEKFLEWIVKLDKYQDSYISQVTVQKQ